MQNDHPLVRELRAALIIQAAVRGKKLRGWAARARAALAEDSGLRDKRLKMGRRQVERDLKAARKGAVKVRIVGGNTVAGRIGRRCENRMTRLAFSPACGIGSIVLFVTFYVFLWMSLVNDTDEYWHVLLALSVGGVAYQSLLLVGGLEIPLVKFCYQHLVSWLNMANLLRWSIAFLLCRGGSVTNAMYVLAMWNFILYENVLDAAIGVKLGQNLLFIVVILAYCTTLYLLSTQRLWRATESEFVPARELNVFGNTTFSYTVELREAHNSALLQLLFFVAADAFAYLRMAYKLRTFNVPPYRSVRIRIPLHLEEHHEWAMRLDDPKLAKRLEKLFYPSQRPASAAPRAAPVVVVQAEASASEAAEATASQVARA